VQETIENLKKKIEENKRLAIIRFKLPQQNTASVGFEPIV